MGTLWIFICVSLFRSIEISTAADIAKPQGQWQWLDCSQHCTSCVDVKPEICQENETFYYDGDPCGCCDACIALSDVGEPCLHAMSLQKTSTQSRVVVSTKVCREGLICSRGLCIVRQKTPCNTENRGLSYVSRCDPQGFYMPFQCSGSHCWCVNRFSGNPIPDSKRPWDFYWINLDSRFGCPPQKDLNHLIDTDEDENSSRWRRSVDNLYFPGYQNADGTFKPVKELEELYSNLVQLKVALDRLSKDDVNLIMSLFKEDILCKNDMFKSSIENMESKDYQSIPSPEAHKERISRHLIHTLLKGPTSNEVQSVRKVKRHLLEVSEPGKVVLQMTIDCPDKSTTPSPASTTVGTILEESAAVNETKKSKGKRKLKRKKVRVTRATQEEKSWFQRIWDQMTIYFQLLYQTIISFFSSAQSQSIHTPSGNMSKKSEENLIKMKGFPSNEDTIREDMYEENLYHSSHPMQEKMNLNCRNLNKEECESQMNKLFKTLAKFQQEKSIISLQKRSVNYYNPFLKISSEFSNSKNTDNINSHKSSRKANKLLRFSEEMWNFPPNNQDLSNSCEKSSENEYNTNQENYFHQKKEDNSMEWSEEKNSRDHIYNSFENFYKENNKTSNLNEKSPKENVYETSTIKDSTFDENYSGVDQSLEIKNVTHSEIYIENSEEVINSTFTQINIDLSVDEMYVSSPEINDESKEMTHSTILNDIPTYLRKSSTKTSTTAITPDDNDYNDRYTVIADSDEEENITDPRLKTLGPSKIQNQKLTILYKIKETLSKNDTDNEDKESVIIDIYKPFP